MKLLFYLLEGSLTTLLIFFLTLILSIPLAVIVYKGKVSKIKVIRFITNLYIMIIRGTPLILQIIFVYFAPYYIFQSSFNRFTAVIFAFTINYAAYFAEIYRGGVQSLDVGQIEASKTLGLSKTYTFFNILLPQIIKNILPSMANEVITLVKDTALAQTIGVAELFRVAQNASSREFSTLPLFIAGVFYFIMNYLVSKGFIKLEKKLSYF